MSIHVCKCTHNGRTAYHLRYPGMSKKNAQAIADMINAGALDTYRVVKKEHQKKEEDSTYTKPTTNKKADMKYIVYSDVENISKVILFDEHTISDMVAKLELLSVISAGITVVSCVNGYLNVACFNDPYEDTYTSRLELDETLINNYLF